jgi:hypothetical protein
MAMTSSPKPADALSSWPLRTCLELAAIDTAVPCARGLVRILCLEWGVPELAETTELLASELVTNALLDSRRLKIRADLAIVPVIRLWVASDKASIVIHVWDANDQMPVRRNVTPDQECGRGLLLVEALGKDWGAYREAEGRVVWVLITLPGDP